MLPSQVPTSEVAAKLGSRHPPISSGGGLYVDTSMVQNNGTMEFSSCSTESDGAEPQAEDET
jgi:hypothetical protein